ncbi:MAG: PEP-utilizing enzyme [Castellaniella sp.]|uniref:PEP-utilizing enzyme n=1 Tax=Castellaniella sp. TaxID=1955812 RepID=UPI003C754CB0
MSLEFSTKARTLAALRGKLTSAHILPLVHFSVAEWHQDRQACLLKIRQDLEVQSVIVRSSCGREDGDMESNAGAFLSLANVLPGDVEHAVEKVIASYGDAEESDEVLIQPMLAGVTRSGVAFTHDPNTSAPYRMINWSEGDDTAVVTSGAGGRIYQRAALSTVPPPGHLALIFPMLDELLRLFDDQAIDCEFAMTQGSAGAEDLWLLQARPLVLRQRPQATEAQAHRLQQIEEKVRRGMQPHPFVMGRRTVYGVMPDWNPAEIIGVRPKPLALSLYRELVTDSIWAYQRNNYGYRNLRSFPLMPHFFGLPYVDVRLSFNSFIPADLDEGLAARLVDYYIDRLLAEPSLHDKVEFEVVFSCYTLDLPKRVEKLAEAGFNTSEQHEIAESLRRLTNRIINQQNGLWRTDASKLDTLQARREALLAGPSDPLERIYWLLEDGKRYGTLPFAGLARAGFIAIQMLKSLVTVGVFSQQDYDAFVASVSTVSGQLARDRSILDKTTFLSRYGHLRPGTYDVLSPRYDETPDLYFDWQQRPVASHSAAQPFSLTLPQMREMVHLLAAHGLEPDAVGLMDFMQEGIELRELAKFHFTRNLSDAMALMAQVGAQYGFTLDDLAYSDVAVFREMHVAAVDARELLATSIEQGRKRHHETKQLSMPPLIAAPEDVWGFEWPETAPNYITQKQVTAPVVSCDDKSSLAGAIVCISNADPGFDWLFSHPIAGLITAWGGANSHMAIRAGELGLPAVIGAGEVLYRRWSSAQRLHIDCAGRRVELVT